MRGCYCAVYPTSGFLCNTKASSHPLLHSSNTEQLIQLSEAFYILTTTLLKISLGLFFLRVLTKRWQTLIFHVSKPQCTNYM
jgi:hypothetical protein